MGWGKSNKECVPMSPRPHVADKLVFDEETLKLVS